MDLADIIRALKTDIEIGSWANGHISRSSFPLSLAKSKNYKFGPEYCWRVVKFDCLGRSFRVLIVLNENKQIYRATLGVEIENDISVLCQHEFHASEPGWHCHLTLGAADGLPVGVVRSHLRRWPHHSAAHSRMEFKVDKASGLTVAADLFRFSAQGGFI